MKKISKLIIISFIVMMVYSLTGCKETIKTIKKEVNTNTGRYEGQTIIIHTNDVHGALEGYSYLPVLKEQIEQQGGTVILVDSGDFLGGSIYVTNSNGAAAITLMDQVEYDVIALGNHEFDYGSTQLLEDFSTTKFNTVCSNIFKDGETIFDEDIIYQVGSLKIGFFGISTPEIQTKANPSLIKDLTIAQEDDLYKIAQEEADKLNKKCDLVICLAHLGVDEESKTNRSSALMERTSGIDILLDGHSHTVMTNGDLAYPIQQAGSEFSHIGFVVIDNNTKEIVDSYLISTQDLKQDSLVKATADNIIATVNAELDINFASTTFKLDGEKALVRTCETNLGNLITDGLIWTIKNDSELEVDDKHIVGILNGGCIRDSIEIGDISKKTVKTILPFGNTVAVCYVTGTELLEALEASTYCTPEPIGGFPQISGMKITIDTSVTYKQGEQYPNSTYFAPKEITRVTIDEVNGQAFDPQATYAVITNNFVTSGGDTYYVFANSNHGFVTSIFEDEALANFIKFELGGVIPEKYAEVEGRITIK